MKARLPDYFIHRYAAIVLFILFFPPQNIPAENKPLMRKQALIIAEKTKEVEGLYSLEEGRFQNCIEKEILRPCDTDWVTCIEDAWVARFVVGDICKLSHDGRLSVTIVIDGMTGEIISRFPESEYFTDPQHCVADYDCLLIDQKQRPCLNFVYGQLQKGVEGQSGRCLCKDSQCRVK